MSAMTFQNTGELLSALGAEMERGGTVMIPLAATAIALWALLFERWRALKALERRWTARSESGIDLPLIQKTQRDAGLRLTLPAALVTAATLLGLLGTVSGMVESFQVLAWSGMGDFSGLSRGIAKALVTTQAGLLVALPGLFAHWRLSSRADALLRRAETELFIRGLQRRASMR